MRAVRVLLLSRFSLEGEKSKTVDSSPTTILIGMIPTDLTEIVTQRSHNLPTADCSRSHLLFSLRRVMTSCNRLARLLIFILAATSLSCLESVVAFDPLSLGQSINGNSRLIQPDAADVGVPTSVNPEPPILPNQQTSQRRGPRPTRRKSLTRRPRYYWRDVANVEYELREFWSQLQIHIPKTEPPPIPNESLLRHMGRHNLRAAIVAHGGRELLSEQLGGARIIPGKWTEAVATSPELQQLIDPTQNQRNCDRTSDGSKKDKNERNQQQQPSFSVNLHRDIPPWSLPQATKETNSSLPEETLESLKRKRWCHTEGRNPKGYWSLQQVIQELYVVASCINDAATCRRCFAHDDATT